MSITVSYSDSTIEITGVTANPSEAKAHEIMSAVSNALGQSLGVMKMSGIWVIADTTSHGWKPLFGHKAGDQTRKFADALGRALNKTVTLTK